MINIQFKNGKIHKIEPKQIRFTSISLTCGLMVTKFLSTKHQWHFTCKKVTCERCLRKKDKPKITDLSNYHSFIK